MIKHLKRELAMNEKENENFGDSTKCCICNKAHFDGDVKVRHHCHITGKYRGSVDRYCNIKVELSYKFPVVFHNLKNYDGMLLSCHVRVSE